MRIVRASRVMLRSFLPGANEIVLKSDSSLILGRNKSTRIKHRKVSRKQVTIEYDVSAKRAKVTAQGIHPSYVNNTQIGAAGSHLKHGDKLSLIKGHFDYEFVDRPAAEIQKDPAIPMNEVGSSSGWTKFSDQLVLYIPENVVKNQSRIACFDLDGNLITTQSGNVFPKNENDWRVIYPEVPKKLRELHNQGWRLVILSNQKGVHTGKVKLVNWQKKVDVILKLFNLPITVMASIGASDSKYRKPQMGMWQHLLQYEHSVEVQNSQCFYVGDAAGSPFFRPVRAPRRKDHSCGDRLFASNIGLPFATPEKFFLGDEDDEHELPKFNPKQFVLSHGNGKPLLTDGQKNAHPLTPATVSEIILMVGYPGSGKSTFVHEYLVPMGYFVANRDTLKTSEKCVQMCLKQIKEGNSIVVDNTNPDKASRKTYINVARQIGCEIRAFVMNCDHSMAQHNIKYRSLIGTDKLHKNVNEMVLNNYKSKFEAVKLDEGFNQVLDVNLIPKFNDDHDRKLYCMYLVEK